LTAFGVMLPSFASGTHRLGPAALSHLSRRIEALGFDSIWAIDHFLAAPMYGQTWMDPLLTLTFVAANTSKVKVGTGVLVLPLRNPVHVARDVAALRWLSEDRFILGVGAGWNPLEFEASQVSRSERGRRTDESLDVLRLLLSGQRTSYEGRYFRFPEILIEPAAERPPPIWVGGGSQPPGRGSTGESLTAPDAVIHRIAAADGWIAPSTSTPDLIAADWARIQAAASATRGDASKIVFAHMNAFHLVDTDDRERAHAEQKKAFARYLGPARPWKFARECYLVGSLGDVVDAICGRIAIGVRYFILGPIVSDVRELERQLELLVTKVIPAFAELPSTG
jgi:probable F420-dependent oxidoreductase